ncbi:MAG: IS256 family transposase [Acholeplasmataceae bacterium]|nr:IS256 family transposase [Acholeplasmataceae bacterium]
MSNFNTEIFKSLSQGISIEEIIRLEIEEVVNQLLLNELTIFLDYEKHDVIGYNSGNSRNGFYSRKLLTKYGEISIKMPRDRNGEFKQQTVPAYDRRTDSLETTVLQLYSRGVTTSEIADLIEKMYGHAYTKQTISNITKAVEVNVDAFHNRKFNKRYVALYCDATMLNVRRDTVAREALHIIIGITEEGHKDVLDYRLYPHEAASNYTDMLQDLYERGLEEVLIIISDGLTGIKEACLKVYPKADHQTCWVHIQRNIAKLVRATDRKEIMNAVKPLYQSQNLESANSEFNNLKDTIGKKYPKVIKLLETNESLFSFYKYPMQIRRSIYTTNLVEGLNKQLKRQTKKKEQFPNEESLERFVCNYFLDYNARLGTRVHIGFGEVTMELNELFNDRYKKN